ncbi:DUF6734 family protein [Spirosoma fluviale]|uniref:DUF6734 domain-containing protein n=1 Tax=Spirosoma fluviale TaxID=1597977 RepID=A0A286FIJ1_9BACT|nr:DUF6734 family protein [Spirosoma fluviale]SOD83040.1 hypothetical protein SAMN06269250_2342 [Spirosoma fluviale]
MKGIQSFWLRETEKKYFTCGWLDTKYNLFSWVLSSLQLTQFYNKRELITDSIGAELAIGKLQLPYTHVSTDLETIKQDNYFWVSNKLYTYSIQNEPFIHLDTDAYLFKQLHSKLLTAPLVAQNFEYDHTYYTQSFQEVIANCTYLPDFIRTDELGRLTAVNAGLIGGTNVSFFKEFETFTKEFFQKNETGLRKCTYENINIFVEQFLFKKFADYKNIPIDYVSSIEFGPAPDYQMANFTQLPTNCPYIHVMNYKRNSTVCEQLAQRLWLESPELYERVLTVCRELEATHHPISQPVQQQIPSPFYRTAYLLESVQLPNPIGPSVAALSTHIQALPENEVKSVLEDVYQFEYGRQRFIDALPGSATLTQHWQTYSRQTNTLLALPAEVYHQQSIRLGRYCQRIESDWNWAETNEFAQQTADRDLAHNLHLEPSYHEVVLYIYLHQGIVREQLLDALNMLILDTLEAPASITSVIDGVCDQVAAYQSEVDRAELVDTILSRIRHFLYHGVLEVCE